MIKVAVLGAGGGIGQSVIKALKGTGYYTVAMNSLSNGAGLYLADTGVIIPPASDPAFIPEVLAACRKHKCKYLFPGLDAELPLISAKSHQFSSYGIYPIISHPEVVELSDSKWALCEFLYKNGFPYIPTFHYPTALSIGPQQNAGISWSGPTIVKPTRGHRSIGMAKVNSTEEALRFVCESPEKDLIAQEYIEGVEYTCGTVSFTGQVDGVICMTRELRNGDTYKAKVDQNPIVIEFVRRLIEKIQPHGACNVQLILRDKVPYVLEINARTSGTTAARALVGMNEPLMILDYLEHKGMAVPEIKDGYEIYRYWEEVVVRPEDKIV